MMRLAWVPLPAPGGPSNTTGPTSREVSCAIKLAKSPEQGSATPHKLRPVSTTPNASAARREAIIVAHDQLRLDLCYRIHGHAHHNQQRSPAKIEIPSQPVGYPHRKALKQRSSQPERQVVQVNAGDHPL